MDGAVDVTFGGEIDDRTRLVLGQQFGRKGTVTNVTLDEEVSTIALQACQILQIARVGKFVEVEHRFAVLR
jgi:hypothetical protein